MPAYLTAHAYRHFHDTHLQALRPFTLTHGHDGLEITLAHVLPDHTGAAAVARLCPITTSCAATVFVDDTLQAAVDMDLRPLLTTSPVPHLDTLPAKL